MYASTASITHNNGIQLTLEQTLAPASSTTSGKTKSTRFTSSTYQIFSGSAGSSGSTSSTGTNSSGDNTSNGKVGHCHLNNAFYLNNMRSPVPPPVHQPLPPPYVNNRLTGPPPPPAASLPASVRATPTADFELYPRHLRTNSYTQATQHFLSNSGGHHAIQSTPLHRRFVPEQFQLRPLRSDSCNSISGGGPQHLASNSSPSSRQQQLLYDKLHGRQSSSSAG